MQESAATQTILLSALGNYSIVTLPEISLLIRWSLTSTGLQQAI
jgi:hypothetical protein